MTLSEFKEKYKKEILNGEHKLINMFLCIKSIATVENPNIDINLKIGKWSKQNDKFYRWDSSLKIDVKNTNSDIEFQKAVKIISKALFTCYSQFLSGGDPKFDSFEIKYYKSSNFRNKQLKSDLYQDFIKWIGDKEPYPGDENVNEFLPRIELIKGSKPDSESSGERMVRIFLEKHNVKYKQYHRIKKCFSELNGRCYTLPFDFYLPKTNTLIEYDGEQHYKPVSMWGGEEGFKRQQLLDGIKNEFCKDNNITLIRIPYTVKNEDKLKEYLTLNILGVKG